jgi:hypothetical protein
MAWTWRSFLEDLAGDVEREVVGGHHAADEAQGGRQEIAPVVHDENALDVEREAPVAAVAVVQVEGRLGRDVQERARLEASLDVHAEVLQRVVPVMAYVLVELPVLLLGDLVLAARPDRLHGVERLALEADGVRDEVGVALDDVL